MLFVVFEFLALELRVVHLAEEVDHFLEEVTALLVVFECVVLVADVEHEFKHVALSLDRAEGVDVVECVLLEDHEVNELGLPEELMVAHWHTVVTEDVDLVVCVLTLADDVLCLLHHLDPAWSDLLSEVLADLRVLEILGV